MVLGSNRSLRPPLANPELRFKMKWDGQWVLSLGAEYELSPLHLLRIGYNYRASPVPDAYVSPLFPATVEHHLTVGYALTMDNLRLADAAKIAAKSREHCPFPTSCAQLSTATGRGGFSRFWRVLLGQRRGRLVNNGLRYWPGSL